MKFAKTFLKRKYEKKIDKPEKLKGQGEACTRYRIQHRYGSNNKVLLAL